MATRYTLSLPSPVYMELKEEAAKQDVSIKEVLTRCLKIGLIAMKADENPNMEIIVRELSEDNKAKETRLVIT